MNLLRLVIIMLSMTSAVFSGCFAPEDDLTKKIDQGVSALDDGDAVSATRIFEDLLQHPDCCSGYLYFNLAVAHHRLEQPASAVAAMLAARYFLPRDSFVVGALGSFVRDIGVDSQDLASLRPWWKRAIVWLDWLSPREHWYMATIMTSLFLFITAYFVWRRKITAAPLLPVIIFFLSFAAWTGFILKAKDADRWAVVASEMVEVFSGPSVAGHRRLHSIAKGTTVYLEAAERDWHRIRWGETQRGWVAKENLVRFPPKAY